MYTTFERTQHIDLEAAGGDYISLDGVTLTELLCWPSDISLGAAKPVLEVETISGRYAAVDSSLEDLTGAAYAETRELGFTLNCDRPVSEMASVKQAVGAYNGLRCEVYSELHGGYFTGRVSIGAWEDGFGASTCPVTVECDPLMHGDDVSFSVSAGTTYSKTISGNRPTAPVFTLTPSSSSATSIVITANGYTFTISSDSALSGTVIVDCENQICTVDGEYTAPTIESDYPILSPGTNSIKVTYAKGTVSYTPYYMI